MLPNSSIDYMLLASVLLFDLFWLSFAWRILKHSIWIPADYQHVRARWLFRTMLVTVAILVISMTYAFNVMVLT